MLSFFWTGRLTDFVFNSWTWFRSLGRRLLGLPAPFVAAPTSGVSRKNSYRILRRESSVSSLSSITSGTISPRKSASRKHLRKKSSRSLRKASLANDPHLAIKQLLAAPKKKKILVLDLDETLIHSTSKGSKNHDHLIEVLVDKHVCLYVLFKHLGGLPCP